jgi:hypothetical protein
VVLLAIARALRLPYPALLALAGAAVAHGARATASRLGVTWRA